VLFQEIEKHKAALHECEDEFARSLLTVDSSSVDSLLADNDLLNAKCEANVRSLDDLCTKFELESKHDPHATSISAIQHQWTQLITKVLPLPCISIKDAFQLKMHLN